jgi:uncharacterized protein (TIGR02598 family)
MSRPDRESAGFSLVEVTLALGIMAFCLVAVFGLLPTGLNTSRDAIAQTAAANIAGAISADLRQAPAATTTIPNPQSPRFLITPTVAASQTVTHTLFFTQNGTVATSTPATSAQDANADPTQYPVYRAALVFSRTNAAAADRTATSVRILITWPALADPGGGTLPVHGNSSFETMIALARN